MGLAGTEKDPLNVANTGKATTTAEDLSKTWRGKLGMFGGKHPWLMGAGAFVGIPALVIGGVYAADGLKDWVIEMALGDAPLGPNFMDGISGGGDTATQDEVKPVSKPATTPKEIVPQIPTDGDKLPGGAKALAGADTADKPAPADKAEAPAQESVSDKEEARRATLIQNQSYETARLNIDQIADPTVNAPQTEEQIDAFRKALANRLEVDPSEISEETARKVLQTGGYTADNGRSFEVWQKQGSNDFFFVDNPYEHYPPASPSAPDVETFTPDKPAETEQRGYRFNGRWISADGNVIPPAELPDSQKSGFDRYSDAVASSPEEDFEGGEAKYNEAVGARDSAWGGEEGMRKDANLLGDYTVEQIATEPPPPDKPELEDEWLKMQTYLHEMQENLPRPTTPDQNILLYLRGIGLIN